MTTTKNLAALSDNELIAHIQRVHHRSRQCTAELIRSLLVVHERRLHLKTANPSIYEFCVRKLGMCNGSAHRYSVAVRLAAQFPHVVERIERGELHLSTLVEMRHHLTPENADELVDRARGKSLYQVQEMLAGVAPRPDVPARMRKLPTPRNAQSVAPITRPLEPLAPERYRVQFNADREAHDGIVRARDLMRHSNPSGDLDEVMKYCVHAGVERLEARQRGLVRRREPRTTDRKRAPTSRHVPRGVRRAVFERDGAQCTFHDEAGNRCPATTLLELDHVDPYAMGGVHTVENLCVRCRPHNKYSAEKFFGKSFIEKRIRERQRKNVPPSRATNGANAGAVPASAPPIGAKGLKKAKEPRTTKARGSHDRTVSFG